MKIAFANNLYYPYNRGGAETVIKKMLADLKSNGHEVFLISTKAKNENTPPESQLKIYYLNSDYLRLADLNYLLKIIWHITNLFSFKKTKIIKQILIKEKPDLIITHNLMGLGFLLPLALKKLNIRQEHYLHDIQLLHPSGLMLLGQEKMIDSLAAKIYQFFTRTFFNSPAKVISPSLWLLAQHRQRGFFKNSETEIKILKPDLIKISPSAKKITTPKKFLFVGQIENHKGIIFLLNAFIEALKIKPEINLTVVGQGKLLLQAKKIGADQKQIKFLGHLDENGVRLLMEESDCLVVPSLCYENAPMTIYEAHNTQLTVLAANIGGIPEIIKNDDRLFKPGDTNDLKNKLLNLF